MKNLIILIAILALTSCKTHFVTQYRVTTAERSFYCNHPQFDEKEKVVRGAELKRDGTILRVFEIPFYSIVSVDYNDKLYNWR